MSVERVFKWTCNRCGKIVERSPYGLPKDWIYLPALINKRSSVQHLCEVCKNIHEEDV